MNDNLLRGCFPLRKWVSNHSSVLRNFYSANDNSKFIQIGGNRKILGFLWGYDSDILKFKNNPIISNTSTKKSILHLSNIWLFGTVIFLYYLDTNLYSKNTVWAVGLGLIYFSLGMVFIQTLTFIPEYTEYSSIPQMFRCCKWSMVFDTLLSKLMAPLFLYAVFTNNLATLL